MKNSGIFLLIMMIVNSCAGHRAGKIATKDVDIEKYTPFTLTTDMSQLTSSEKKMLPYLFEAADIMNELFWYEAYGKKNALLSYLQGDARKFAEINYGPWDRLANNKAFVVGMPEKPLGANFYPTDMSKEEFAKAALADGNSLYTFVRRDMKGKLYTIPYHQMFSKEVKAAADLLRQAAVYAEDKDLKKYLLLRADALQNDDYTASDLAWMDMKNNTIDIIIGPIETYEDKLFGQKAAHEAYVLVKDKNWSARLAKYADFLPELQQNLPVADRYKQEKPGTDSDLNAYDVIYYAGDCNAGSKTIAINLPNDESVQLQKGTRRLQLKNAMQAKFDKILMPISKVLVDPAQQHHVKFDAFFANTMFHEVAHGLGIKNTVNNKGSVREALKEHASALEEGKADILGLYMVNQLLKKGELEGDVKDYLVTFMSGIFRSVRFGAGSAHGKANMITFNYFKEANAFSQNPDGSYRVNFENMENAMNNLSQLILELQGNGDYNAVDKLLNQKGIIPVDLQKDLNKLNHIPVDVVFNQGLHFLK
ncbi:MAG: Zn-dependent hydrolase [Flavobacteriaceae bacterium]|nr:Zn-dependent hydrolase [Flavobacteriaceae bacterium]